MLKLKQSLHDFFDASTIGTPDKRYIHVINEWGQEIIISGLEVIRDRIHNVGISCPEVMKLGPDVRLRLHTTNVGCMQAFDVSWRMESAFSWMLEELGVETSDNTLFQLLTYSDYDIAILAANMLNWNQHDRTRVDKHLLTAFNSRTGTAFRLAVATILYLHNINEPLEMVAVPHFIPNVADLKIKLSDEEKERRKKDFLATNPAPEELSEFLLDGIGDAKRKFLGRTEKIITWDMATNGKGPRERWPGWWIRE